MTSLSLKSEQHNRIVEAASPLLGYKPGSSLQSVEKPLLALKMALLKSKAIDSQQAIACCDVLLPIAIQAVTVSELSRCVWLCLAELCSKSDTAAWRLSESKELVSAAMAAIGRGDVEEERSQLLHSFEHLVMVVLGSMRYAQAQIVMTSDPSFVDAIKRRLSVDTYAAPLVVACICSYDPSVAEQFGQAGLDALLDRLPTLQRRDFVDLFRLALPAFLRVDRFLALQGLADLRQQQIGMTNMPSQPGRTPPQTAERHQSMEKKRKVDNDKHQVTKNSTSKGSKPEWKAAPSQTKGKRKFDQVDEVQDPGSDSDEAKRQAAHQQFARGTQWKPTSDNQVLFNDIVGQDAAVDEIQKAFLDPLDNPGLFPGSRTDPKGLLLVGPPGTGKTSLVKALVCEGKMTLFNLTCSDLLHPLQGEQEGRLRAVFALAKQTDRAVIFIDEIDKVFGVKRQGDHNEGLRGVLQTGMSGLDSSPCVRVVAATNKRETLDPALARRFAPLGGVLVGLPSQPAIAKYIERWLSARDASCRQELKKKHAEATLTGWKSHTISPAEVSVLAKQLDGLSIDAVKTIFESSSQPRMLLPPEKTRDRESFRKCTFLDCRPLTADDVFSAMKREAAVAPKTSAAASEALAGHNDATEEHAAAPTPAVGFA